MTGYSRREMGVHEEGDVGSGYTRKEKTEASDRSFCVVLMTEVLALSSTPQFTRSVNR